MSIHVALSHTTHYRYERPITLGPQIVRLRPCPHARTRILSYSLKVEPEGYFLNWQQDPQANYLARLVFPEKTDELKITVDLVAEMAVINRSISSWNPGRRPFPSSMRNGRRRSWRLTCRNCRKHRNSVNGWPP